MAGHNPFIDTFFAHRNTLRVRRPSLSLPTRERTWFRRLGETRALASLPRKLSGENKRGLAFPRRKQEGSCDAGILRFSHRLTDPRCGGEHRSPEGLAPNPSGTHEHRKAKTDADR